MDHYGLLDQADEGMCKLPAKSCRARYNPDLERNADAIHASRLLNIEEKLYRRIQKRLLAPESCISAIPQAPPTPPPDANAADEAAAAKETEVKRRKRERECWRSDALLDFAAFEGNVTRVQFLLDSNDRERRRYADEKERILETAQAVRDNNVLLHQHLEDAQNTLALRKTYDALADKITSNPALKSRDEQHAQIEKLHIEIADLEHEGHEYKNTWAERREQFGKIVEEGTQMLRLIRDEKEEAERKEEVMEGVEDGGGDTPRGVAPSRSGTPRPEEVSSLSSTTQQKSQLLEPKEQVTTVSSSDRSSRSGSPPRDTPPTKSLTGDALGPRAEEHDGQHVHQSVGQDSDKSTEEQDVANQEAEKMDTS
ncbi:MAG: hypothetical protein M1828_006892 [Chrysothrix sp. TS-e1954]|nr:MAG: hypothetical protein M1828_006892 [Chrysothrix sp. TS-e1954]